MAALGLFMLATVGSLVAFTIDGRAHSSQVLRNTTLILNETTGDQLAIGGLSASRLAGPVAGTSLRAMPSAK